MKCLEMNIEDYEIIRKDLSEKGFVLINKSISKPLENFWEGGNTHNFGFFGRTTFYQSERTAKIALTIAKKYFPNDQIEIVYGKSFIVEYRSKTNSIPSGFARVEFEEG